MSYEVQDDGVWEVGESRKRITVRPVWVIERGQDVITGEPRVKLRWVGPYGQQLERWVEDADLRQPGTLARLPQFPVAQVMAIKLVTYIQDEMHGLKTPMHEVASRVGWYREAGVPRFYMPDSVPGVEYVGERAWPLQGELARWSEALAHLRFEMALTALAVLGLSAASPLVRPLAEAHQRRRPVIGLVASSSTGKGTVINAALSLWGPPGAMTAPAASTFKGIQDMSVTSPDLPLFADELQQVLKRPAGSTDLEAIMYYLGNGQQRFGTTPTQTVLGGAYRYGAGFYASELSVTLAIQTGAQNRVFELQGPPLPNPETAALLQQATQNVGVVGRALTQLINAEYQALVARIQEQADTLQNTHECLRGDDAFTLALVEVGLGLLSRTCDVELPVAEVLAFLIDQVGQQRKETISPESAALHDVWAKVCGAEWTGEVLLRDGEFVAWRGPDHLDLNPMSRMVREALREFPNHKALVRRWAEAGWLDHNNNRYTYQRRTAEGGSRRVWRVNAAGLQHLGIGLDREGPDIPAQ